MTWDRRAVCKAAPLTDPKAAKQETTRIERPVQFKIRRLFFIAAPPPVFALTGNSDLSLEFPVRNRLPDFRMKAPLLDRWPKQLNHRRKLPGSCRSSASSILPAAASDSQSPSTSRSQGGRKPQLTGMSLRTDRCRNLLGR